MGKLAQHTGSNLNVFNKVHHVFISDICSNLLLEEWNGEKGERKKAMKDINKDAWNGKQFFYFLFFWSASCFVLHIFWVLEATIDKKIYTS